MAKAQNNANLGFEQKLWQSADKLRNNMDAAEYKHIVLGLIFLKYISDAFEELHQSLSKDPNADPEELEEELDSGAPTEEPPEPLFGIEDEEAVTE